MWCRGRMVAWLLLLLTLAGADETFQESPLSNVYDQYMQEEDSMEHKVTTADPKLEEEESESYAKFYQYLLNQFRPKYDNSPFPSFTARTDIQPVHLGRETLKPVYHKRFFSSLFGSSPPVETPKRKVPLRWKTKKGAHVVCYFKLCAFSPLTLAY